MMRKLLILSITMSLLSACSLLKSKSSSKGSGVSSASFADPVPSGMVLIPQGSIRLGTTELDTLWGITNPPKEISVESFWMDETEVTNNEYKQFLYYVRDSIIRERLADPAYGGNELYKITENKQGDPVTPHLDWSRPIPSPKRATEEELSAIESVYYIDPVDGTRRLDPKQMYYRYEWYDYKAAAERRNQLDPAMRSRNTDIKPDYKEVILITKDTAYINEAGKVVNETITRPLSGPWDFLNTRIVNIYPDETCWINDFEHASNEPYMRRYFTTEDYGDFPVVGVSWEQATAFCAWRTENLKKSMGLKNAQIEPFRLPTEGEWEFAARCGKTGYKYPWESQSVSTERGCYYGNFKPAKGNYTQDGNLITSKVASYPPNEFGLYDMAGNVSEWTSTAYTESGAITTGDINPDLRYNAAPEDPYKMKRKVVRGGSWKDISTFIRSDVRSFEYQNEQRSYIGFRCVRTRIGNVKVKGKK